MARSVPAGGEPVTLRVGEREVVITHPDKVLFPEARHTKLDLAKYYLAVAEGALRAVDRRPTVLVRYPDGVGGEFFFQKRAPSSRPPWLDVVSLAFPSGRTAEEVVPREAAALAWMANLGCLELHPHPVRAEDLDHPDELRVDLDPVPGVAWSQVRQVAMVVRAALADLGLTGWPKTSGSRGMHVYVRIERRWTFDQVRRAALALARDVERRAPSLATSKWWKEERHGVFIDYNQNAKDRTVAAAYSVRPTPDARVSAPLDWDEVEACDPADFTLVTMPGRFAAIGDRHAGDRSRAAGPRRAPRTVVQARARRTRRCAVATALPQAARRTGARPAVTSSRARAPAGRDRPRATQGGCAGGAGAVEGATSGCRRTPRAGRRARRCHARTAHDMDPRAGEPPARARSHPAGAGCPGSRRGHEHGLACGCYADPARVAEKTRANS